MEKARDMEFGGRYRIAAPRMRVWQALNDPEVLKAAVPGCQRIAWVGTDTLELELAVNLGVVRPRFAGELVLSDVHPAERYRLTGRGRGGLLGGIEGTAAITLEDIEADTLLVFRAEGGASGQVMKLGKAVIGTSAQRVIDGFFGRLGAAIGAEVVPLGSGDAETGPPKI